MASTRDPEQVKAFPTPIKTDKYSRSEGKGQQSSATPSPASGSTPRKRWKRSRRSSDDSEGSLADFVVGEGSGKRQAKSPRTSGGYEADGFVVGKVRHRKDRNEKKLSKGPELESEGEESALSDLYSQVSEVSGTDETDVEEFGDEDLDPDFVPKKRLKPSLLGMELR